jgi:hypothetical protein
VLILQFPQNCVNWRRNPWNTQAFLCFQIVQTPRIIRVFTPFFCSFTLLNIIRNQSAKLLSFWQGTKSVSSKGWCNLNHTCLATTHVVNRCCIVSSSWSHRGHLSGWGRPLLASLSAVQHLFRIANHRNILHSTSQLLQASNGPGCYIHSPLRADALGSSPHMCQMSRSTPWYTLPWAACSKGWCSQYHL